MICQVREFFWILASTKIGGNLIERTKEVGDM